MPESDPLWIKWFARLVNVPMVTFITPFQMWQEMPTQQTVAVWTSKSSPHLRRIECWTGAQHVEFTQDSHVRQVWVNGDRITWQRMKYALIKDDLGIWTLLDEETIMRSGPVVTWSSR